MTSDVEVTLLWSIKIQESDSVTQALRTKDALKTFIIMGAKTRKLFIHIKSKNFEPRRLIPIRDMDEPEQKPYLYISTHNFLILSLSLSL